MTKPDLQFLTYEGFSLIRLRNHLESEYFVDKMETRWWKGITFGMCTSIDVFGQGTVS